MSLIGESPGAQAEKKVTDTGKLWDASTWTPEFCESAVNDLMQEHQVDNEQFGVYFLDSLDARSSLGRIVEIERFDEGFGNGPDYMKELYGRYEVSGQTEIIVVIDHINKRPAGVIRTIRNDAENGCPTLNDLLSSDINGWGLTPDDLAEKSDFDAVTPDQIIDIATMAVSKDYSGSTSVDGISRALCAAVFQRSLEDPNAQTWVCALARVPYILIQAYTDNVMTEFEGVEGRPYHGDPDTIPVWSNFRRHRDYLEQHNQELFRRFALSEGLEGYFFAK